MPAGWRPEMRLVLIEALLRRLYALPGTAGLLVRGSFMLRHWVTPAWRGCDDLDLLDADARPFESLTALIEQLVALPAPPGEPVFTAFAQQVIWAESAWPGLRFALESDQGPLQVDVSLGDPLAAPPLTAE